MHTYNTHTLILSLTHLCTHTPMLSHTQALTHPGTHTLKHKISFALKIFTISKGIKAGFDKSGILTDLFVH